MSRAPISIVIPCYNGMPRLEACLSALVGGLADGLVREAIVVDGGSHDHSVDLAKDMGCKVLVVDADQRGRGAQLGAGAKIASGDWLLFLHADTVLQANWCEVVWSHILAPHQEMAAYFQLAFDQPHRAARRVAGLANWRARVLGLPYGDAGLLISRALYDEIGGYQPLPLMEDVDLIRRIGKSRLLGMQGVAQTSGAKFERGGWLRVPLRNIVLAGAFLAGMKPQVLARWYR
jgi:rSAM/selenodomain-associated transferase 2